MTTAMTPSATFETTVTASGNNTGIEVPVRGDRAVGSGSPAARAGRRQRLSVPKRGRGDARHAMIGVSAAVREATGLQGGDPIRVTLTLAEGPREVEMPLDFAEALAADPKAAAFFAGLSNSLQRYHVDTINGAKAADTRRRRVEKAIALFREGRKR
jgi:hypothetical protein